MEADEVRNQRPDPGLHSNDHAVLKDQGQQLVADYEEAEIPEQCPGTVHELDQPVSLAFALWRAPIRVSSFGAVPDVGGQASAAEPGVAVRAVVCSGCREL